MKKCISILIVFISLSTVHAQSIAEAKQDTNIGQAIIIEGEEFPSFPGGNAEFLKCIQKNLVYPQSAKENGISGKVYLKFVINEDGSVDDVQVVRGIKVGQANPIEGEEFPSFPGGNTEFLKFIQKNLVYPQSAKENGISGKVYLKFVIKEDGSVDDVQIVRGIKDGDDLGVEAIRLMKLMPNWIPGKLNGKPVKVTYSVPLTFTMK